MRLISSQILLALGALLVASCPVRADYIEPGAVEVKTASYDSLYKELPDGIIDYSISWQGIPVGRASIRVEKQLEGGNKFFHVQADARTASGIDWIYQLRHRSEGFFAVGSYKPSTFLFRQTENSKKRVTQIAFEPNGVIKTKRWKNDKRKQIFNSRLLIPQWIPSPRHF